MKESFEKEFAILREQAGEAFTLRGSSMIVEIMEDEELKTKGGIIMATDSNQVRGNSINQHRLTTARVLMCGQGYFNEDTDTYEPLEVEPGAIVIVSQISPQFISQFPGISRPTANKLALLKYADVLALYPSAEAYESVKKQLNG